MAEDKKKKRKKRSKEKAEEEEKDEEELEEFLAKLKLKRLRESINRLPIRKAGGGRPLPRIFNTPNLPRYSSEPKFKLPNPKLENYGRRSFGWSEPQKPKTEKMIIRNEPDAEELLKTLERNPKLYDKLSKKLLKKMDQEFDKQLEAKINDAEKNNEQEDKIKDSERLTRDEQRNLETNEEEIAEKPEPNTEQKVLSFEEFAEKHPLELDGKELLSEDTKQEVMRRAYENYLGNEAVNKLMEANEKDSEVEEKKQQIEIDFSDDKMNKEEEAQKEVEPVEDLESEEEMSIEPVEMSESDFNALVEELKERGAISGEEWDRLRALENLKYLDNAEASEPTSEVKDKTEIIDETEKAQVIGQQEVSQNAEVTEIIEPVESQPSVITRLESQDLTSLEAELLQPEIEVEPKIEEAEPVEETGY